MDPDQTLPAALKLLERMNNRAVDGALIEALPELAPFAQAEAIRILCARARQDALATLAERFDKYDGGLQRQILGWVSALEGGIRSAVGAEDVAARCAAIELIRRSADDRLAYVLTTALRSSCPRTRGLAAKALAEFAEREPHRAPRKRDADASSPKIDYLGEALSDAIRSWEAHLQPDVLRAAMRCADRTEAAFERKLTETRTRLDAAIGSVLGGDPDPRLAGFVLRAMTMPRVLPHAVRLIERTGADARAGDLPMLRALGDAQWLIADPRVAAGLARVRKLAWAGEAPAIIAGMDKESGVGLVRIVAASGLPVREKVSVLRDVFATGGDARSTGTTGGDARSTGTTGGDARSTGLNSGAGVSARHDRDPQAPQFAIRRAALWALVGIPGDESTVILDRIAASAEPEFATIAKRELRKRGLPGDARARGSSGGADRGAGDDGQGRPSHGGDGRRAGTPGALSWDRVWVESASDGEVEPIATVKGSPTTRDLLEPLKAKLGSKVPMERIRALRIVRWMKFPAALSEQVYGLCNDPDPMVRGTAIGLLALLPGPISLRILRRSVEDHDPRVQANAIEALAALDERECRRWVEPKLGSTHGRVKANAAAALLRLEVREAADALIDMLDDPARGHRISGLWVIERLHLRTVVQRVAQLSRDDPDPQVRRRAERVLRGLLSGEPMEHWTASGPPP